MKSMVGKRSPWGTIDHEEPICDGIVFVGTPSHGGIKLAAWRNTYVPAHLREAGGWYEEDCAWSIPYTIFADDILASPIAHPNCAKAIREGLHTLTFNRWYSKAA